MYVGIYVVKLYMIIFACEHVCKKVA